MRGLGYALGVMLYEATKEEYINNHQNGKKIGYVIGNDVVIDGFIVAERMAQGRYRKVEPKRYVAPRKYQRKVKVVETEVKTETEVEDSQG